MKNLSNSALTIIMAISLVFGLAGPSVALAAGPAAVNLGTAGNFTVLAKSGISTTGVTSVVGDIGVSPAAATAITGFGLNLTVGSAFATSPQVVGNVYAPNFANPTPATVTTAVGDMETAYTNAAGLSNPTATELGAGNIGGLTIAPGLYKWGTGVIIPADVTLAGGANDVWIFQIAQTLGVSSAKKVLLSGGAQARNIFWIVGGQTTLGTGAILNGTILDQTAIVLTTGAQLNGRALAQTAVVLDANTVTMPAGVAMVPVVAPTPSVTPIVPVVNNVTPNTAVIPVITASPVACTQEAKQCSDGSYVGRSGPDCSFAQCPITPASPTYSAPSTAFSGQPMQVVTKNLRLGSRSSNVTILQNFLVGQNTGSAAQALARVGATGYFGVLTRRALVEFQVAVGIRPAFGNFGAITRAYINAHFN